VRAVSLIPSPVNVLTLAQALTSTSASRTKSAVTARMDAQLARTWPLARSAPGP